MQTFINDALKDVVQHTLSLGLELVKITGDENTTVVNSIAEDRSVILEAKFKGPVAEFIGTFGMPNLSKLNTILNLPVYKEDAKLSINTQDRDGVKVPAGVHFENKDKDFKNDYRFMSSEVINEKLKSVKFRGVKWNVDITPSVSSIQRLRFQASANSEETTFYTKTDNGNLYFYFGDAASHAGNFVFHAGVSGTLNKNWAWPIAAFISILSLPGDKTLKFGDEGAAMITVDSGIAEYSYIIPGQVK